MIKSELENGMTGTVCKPMSVELRRNIAVFVTAEEDPCLQI